MLYLWPYDDLPFRAIGETRNPTEDIVFACKTQQQWHVQYYKPSSDSEYRLRSRYGHRRVPHNYKPRCPEEMQGTQHRPCKTILAPVN